MRTRRWEDIAPMKWRRHRARPPPRGIRDLTRARDAVAIFDERQKPMVGNHEVPPALGFCNHGATLSVDARIDDADEDGASRKIQRRVRQETRAICDVV
jgi:hypothetical protein